MDRTGIEAGSTAGQPYFGRLATRLIIIMCLAEVLSMAGTFAFPSLLPIFFQEWALSNTQAGWINGGYFAGYTAAVSVLVTLTDRIDSRLIFLIFSAVGAAAALGFAFLADGFVSALVFRTLGGLGLAGTYVPGLKALVDRLNGRAQARAVSFYTASFSVGMSLSFYLSGKLAGWCGWRWAFGVAGVLTVMAIPLAAYILKPHRLPSRSSLPSGLFDPRPVFNNRQALAYILTYAVHMWEMFAFRSWMVAFLAYSLSFSSAAAGLPSPSTVAALAGLTGMAASVSGAELALRFGRRRVLTIIMGGSAVFCCFIGFLAEWPYWAVAILSIIYCLFLQGDSAAIHTGVIQSADPHRRGATMALQSLLGFGCASVGPLAVGAILDWTGGSRPVVSWGTAFLSLGFVVALGPVFLRLMVRDKGGPG